MASKSKREIAADNGMWLTHPIQLNVNIKRIVLTGRKHTKIVRPGDSCLNWETNLGDLAGMIIDFSLTWCKLNFGPLRRKVKSHHLP